ncbi:hypothetical protein F0562_014650 [Nyssa sinensis]|uniref:Uncharacterized protein n=1 Tax=Nyssa sinensis TaxID=561372 RepID=A0A5J4ZR76_9ASTE|nr:hypothetical protein F0562_014650 [Nyssa sinensis]
MSMLRKVRDLASAQRASRMGFKPWVDAVNVEAVITFGQLPVPLTTGDMMKAHCTVYGGVAVRVRVEGDDSKVATATNPLEKDTDDEEDDNCGQDCIPVASCDEYGIGKFGHELWWWLMLSKMRDMASTKRASRMGLKPGVDAVNVEAMVAFRQFPVPLAAGDVVKAHCTVKGNEIVVIARVRVEGKGIKVVGAATKPLEN